MENKVFFVLMVNKAVADGTDKRTLLTIAKNNEAAEEKMNYVTKEFRRLYGAEIPADVFLPELVKVVHIPDTSAIYFDALMTLTFAPTMDVTLLYEAFQMENAHLN